MIDEKTQHRIRMKIHTVSDWEENMLSLGMSGREGEQRERKWSWTSGRDVEEPIQYTTEYETISAFFISCSPDENKMRTKHSQPCEREIQWKREKVNVCVCVCCSFLFERVWRERATTFYFHTQAFPHAQTAAHLRRFTCTSTKSSSVLTGAVSGCSPFSCVWANHFGWLCDDIRERKMETYTPIEKSGRHVSVC